MDPGTTGATRLSKVWCGAARGRACVTAPRCGMGCGEGREEGAGGELKGCGERCEGGAQGVLKVWDEVQMVILAARKVLGGCLEAWEVVEKRGMLLMQGGGNAQRLQAA